MAWYVGYLRGDRVAFRCDGTPGPDTGYLAVWGPFRTKRGALFGASWRAVGNPHTVTVGEAERVARECVARGERDFLDWPRLALGCR